jgi:RecB family exonuclease
MATAGSLAELMYAVPELPIDELTGLLVWTDVLRTADEALVAPLLPRRPSSDDLAEWMPLAREIASVRRELAGEDVSCEAMVAHCAGRQFDDSERWRTLARLSDIYEDRLRSMDSPMRDNAMARRDALRDATFIRGRTFVLVGTVDLPRVVRRMLLATPASVLALVHAPSSEGARFDAVGCVDPANWDDWRIPLTDSRLRVVGGPRDQAFEMLDAVEEWNETVSLDKITVGVGDSSLTCLVTRTLAESGRDARTSTGRPVAVGRPAQLLGALADTVDSHSAIAFAALLRHPDIERYLIRKLALGGDAGPWLRSLDRFRSQHLPPRLAEFWPPESADSRTVQDAERAIDALVAPLATGKRPLGEWSEPVAGVLASAYAGVAFDIHDPNGRRMAKELEAIAAALKTMRDASAQTSFSGVVSASEAIRVALSVLAGQATPDEGDDESIEVLGWLELHLDDAPSLVITGFNEGAIPESSGVDALLPNSLRRDAGLVDDRRRFVRDVYMLTAILASRPNVRVIAGRTTAAGDPLRPSRLLFVCDDDELVKRAIDFYADETPRQARVLLSYSSDNVNSLATIPLPIRRLQPLAKVGVTSFKDYIACPYRFYLRHVEGRGALTDDYVEMDASLFGIMAHDVLRKFAGSGLQGDTDAKRIASFLFDELQTSASKQFGKERLPAVEIQLNNIRRRLEAFATFQAAHAAAGWQIERTEVDGEAQIVCAEGTLTVRGRIDRIDRQQSTGEALLLDYKLGDTYKSPAERHRRKEEWVDLQLPLYRHMASALSLDSDRLKLGYICLCKDLRSVGLADSGWEAADFETADLKINQVASGIIRQEFWPPRDPARYVDGFEGICLDRSLDRANVIATLSAGTVGGAA